MPEAVAVIPGGNGNGGTSPGPAQMETVTFNGNGSVQNASGPANGVAQRLLAAGFNPANLRTNALLRRDEWKHFDDRIIDIARERLVILQMLTGRGLVYNLPNALGHTRIEWERNGDMDPAILTMSGLSESQNDRLTFDMDGMPVPIVHKDFNLNIRHLAASRNNGQPLDTMMSAIASRKVSELIESMIFNGATVLGSNNPIYGLTTALYRNTGSLTESWATADGPDIVHDITTIIGVLEADLMYGPYWMFIPKAVGTRWGEDYKTDSDKSILTRIREIEGIQGITATHNLTNSILVVQLTEDVIDIIDGFAPMAVEWDGPAGMVSHFKVMAIQVPRVRNDQLNRSGIAHYTW